jgi:hypothetical protein
MLPAVAHAAGVALPALLSVKMIDGQATSGWTAGVFTRVRLFVSPVKPSCWQVGGIDIDASPLFTAVLTTIVVPLSKTAWFKQQSPKTLNSAVFHWSSRSGKWLSPAVK